MSTVNKGLPNEMVTFAMNWASIQIAAGTSNTWMGSSTPVKWTNQNMRAALRDEVGQLGLTLKTGGVTDPLLNLADQFIMMLRCLGLVTGDSKTGFKSTNELYTLMSIRPESAKKMWKMWTEAAEPDSEPNTSTDEKQRVGHTKRVLSPYRILSNKVKTAINNMGLSYESLLARTKPLRESYKPKTYTKLKCNLMKDAAPANVISVPTPAPKTDAVNFPEYLDFEKLTADLLELKRERSLVSPKYQSMFDPEIKRVKEQMKSVVDKF
jgi:hypothetical protein